MKRRIILAIGTAAFLFAGVAHAQGTVEGILSQLAKQGYYSIVTGRTLLGRTRIIAESDEFRREIIINPRTGEILRDFWTVQKRAKGQILPGDSSSGSGNGIIDFEDDDDDDDDDDDGDNSGSGSSGGGDDDDGDEDDGD